MKLNHFFDNMLGAQNVTEDCKFMGGCNTWPLQDCKNSHCLADLTL